MDYRKKYIDMREQGMKRIDSIDNNVKACKEFIN